MGREHSRFVLLATTEQILKITHRRGKGEGAHPLDAGLGVVLAIGCRQRRRSSSPGRPRCSLPRCSRSGMLPQVWTYRGRERALVGEAGFEPRPRAPKARALTRLSYSPSGSVPDRRLPGQTDDSRRAVSCRAHGGPAAREPEPRQARGDAAAGRGAAVPRDRPARDRDHRRSRGDRQSFLENARIKALAYAGRSDRLTVADDSGLSVDALGGAPGLYSSRFGGEGGATSTATGCCSRSSRTCRPERGARFTSAVAVARGPRRAFRGGGARDRPYRRRAAREPTASATTRSSSIRRTGRPSGRSRVPARTRSATAARRSRACAASSRGCAKEPA